MTDKQLLIDCRRLICARAERGNAEAQEVLVRLDAAIAKPAAEGEVVRFDLIAHLERQREFSLRTFGPGARTAGVCDHIRKELVEIEADPSDVKEWVDVILLALDGAWRSGASPEEIAFDIASKQIKNEGRIWPDWRTADPNKAIEHDRSADTHSPQQQLGRKLACRVLQSDLYPQLDDAERAECDALALIGDPPIDEYHKVPQQQARVTVTAVLAVADELDARWGNASYETNIKHYTKRLRKAVADQLAGGRK